MELLATYYSIATCFSFTPMITVPKSLENYLVDQQFKLIDWFLYNFNALIEEYNSYLIDILFLLFIYLFVLCCLCICLLISLICCCCCCCCCCNLMLLLLVLFLIQFNVVVLVLICFLLICRLSKLYCFFVIVYQNLVICLLSLLCIYFCSSLVS